jgi:hypothetical protein
VIPKHTCYPQRANASAALEVPGSTLGSTREARASGGK